VIHDVAAGLLDLRPVHHHSERDRVVLDAVGRVDRNAGPVLNIGPVYGYADQVPDCCKGS
jgi:hypothetical protein